MKTLRISAYIFMVMEMKKFFVNQKWFDLAAMARDIESELREKSRLPMHNQVGGK